MNGKQLASICVFLVCVTLVLGSLFKAGYYNLGAVLAPETTTVAIDDRTAEGATEEEPEETTSTTSAPETTTAAPTTTTVATTRAATTAAPATTAPPQTTAAPATTKATVAATTTTTASAATPQYVSAETALLTLVNEQRSKAGLGALSGSSQLNYCARIRAQEIITNFSHTRPNGSTAFTVLAENGVGYKAAGENIAVGYGSARDVMNGWMNSQGHRDNILSSKFSQMGSACVYLRGSTYGYYWVQLFIG